MSSGNTKKVIFEVDLFLGDRQKQIPWGIKTQVLAKLLERLLDAVDEHGSSVYGFILDGDFKIQPTKGIEK